MEFRPSPKRLAGPIFCVCLFLGWVVLDIVVFAKAPPRAVTWPAYVITFGVPGAMFFLSVLLTLASLAVVELDRERVRIKGPLGSREVRWADVEGYDIDGAATNGIRLNVRGSKPFGISFLPYEDTPTLRAAILERIPQRDPLRAGPLIARNSGAVALPVMTVAVLGFFIAAFLSIGRVQGAAWGCLALIAALMIPMSLYAFTYRAILDGPVLATTSCFGRKSVDLVAVRSVELKMLRTKNGVSEILTAIGIDGKKIILSGRMSGYVAFRTAILALVPASVIVDKRPA